MQKYYENFKDKIYKHKFDEMKNLIIFIPSIEKAGVEKNLFIICNYLIKKINNISIITANNNFNKKFHNKINIICPKTKFWNNKSRLLKSIYCLFKIFCVFKKDDNILFSFQASLFATIISKIFNYKLILRLNTSPNKYINNNFKKFIFKIIYKSADEIIVNSKQFKNLLKKQLQINSKFIYNPAIFSFKIEKKINRLDKKLQILNIGRLTDQKDQITLLKALNLAKKNNIPFSAKIIGSGYKYNELKNYIKQKDLKNEIHLLGYKDKAYKFMNKASVFILSSKYEGLPNVLIEAQQFNLPIISTNCPSGPKEILMNGKLGELFPVGNYRALYKEIEKFYYSQRKLIKKSNMAKKYLKRFSLERNCKMYFKLINKCI